MIGGPDWLSQQLLLTGLAAVLLSCAVLASIVVGTKGIRDSRSRRRARRLQPYRPALLGLAAGEPDDHDRSTLAAAPEADRALVRDAVVDLLGKVKGESAHDLVAVLDGYDAVGSALTDCDSRSAVRRGRAALLLGRSGRPDVLPALVRLLQDSNPLVRQSAVAAVGELGDPEGAGPVLAALRGRGGRAGVPSGVAIDALLGLGFGIEDRLVGGLVDPDPGVRAAAAQVIGERSAVAALPEVRRKVRTERDPQVQVALCRALGRIGDLTDVPALAEAAARGAAERRLAAVEALGALDVPEAVPSLVALLGDDHRRVAVAAAGALSRMARPEAAAALTDLEDTKAREAASYVLALRELKAARAGAR